MHGLPIERGFLLLNVAYAVAYITLLLIGSVIIFSRRDLK